jgi:hypothetical protein
LNILLKIFAEFAYLLLYTFFGFRLRHSVFTYLSEKPNFGVPPLFSKKSRQESQPVGHFAGLPA